MRSVGTGKVYLEDNTLRYVGSWPNCEHEEEIMILKKDDLERILRTGNQVVLRNKIDMPRDMHNGNLGDEMLYDAPDGTIHKLFLDRHLYSGNFKDEIWVRYVSVDQSIIEEGYNPPNGGIKEEDAD